MEWKNLDTLTSFEELSKVAEVDLTKVMSGENGAERVKKLQHTDGRGTCI